MCGIAGQFNPHGPADDASVRRMASALLHRGPDDDGRFSDPGVELAFRRLSIIDLEGGHQPILSEDERYALILNGEIYNHRELRQELTEHRFRTQSDAEVALHLFEDLGPAAFGRLNGMFALAIYDRRERRLWCARDRYGQKPLHFYESPRGGLVIASEIPALRKHAAVDAPFDPDTLAFYWFYNYVPAPRSVFRGIRKLPPQSYLTYDANGLRIERYELPEQSPPAESDADLQTAIAQTDELLAAAVERHLLADVDVGLFLSGGLDSTLLLRYAVRTNPRIVAFVATFGKHASELPYVKQACRRYGVWPIVLDVSPKPSDLDEVIAAYGEPFGDSAIVSTYLLARAARRHVKAVVTGEGGDELFGGYDEYRAVIDSPDAVALKQRYLQQRTYCGLPRMRRDYRVDSAELQQHLDDLRLRTVADAMRHEQSQRLPDNHFTKVDIATMAHSLEARCPMLDHELSNTVNALPLRLKLSATEQKIIPKRLLAADFPAEFIDRPKRGFGAPVRNWLGVPPFRCRVREVLNSESVNLRAVVSHDHADRLLAALDDSVTSASPYDAWKVYCLLVWLRANEISLEAPALAATV